jgi:hypothetical protein
MLAWDQGKRRPGHERPRRPSDASALERACTTVTDVDSQQIRRKSILLGLINEYSHAT